MQDIVWKDRHIIPYLVVAISLISNAYLIWILYANRSDLRGHLLAVVIGVAWILLTVYHVIAALLPRTTALSQGGIRVGNVIDDKYDYNIFTFKRNAPYLTWSEVQRIEIIEKNVWHTFMSMSKSFILVHTKKGRSYESYLARPKNFTAALKKLGKANLLGKETSSKW